MKPFVARPLWTRHPLAHLIWVRVVEFLREPEAIFWVYIFPLALTLALGIAFRGKPIADVRVGVVADSVGQRLAAELEHNPRFKVTLADADRCRALLRTGRIEIVVSPGDDNSYNYFFDATRPESALARHLVDDYLQRAAGRADPVAAHDREVVEPGGRYIDFLVPGLAGMGLMGGGLWGVGFGVVDMRIRKLLKRYRATPMRRGQFLASLMISRLIFTVIEVAVLIAFSQIVFGVPCFGSYLDVALIVLLGSFAFTGIGLLVACRARTIEAVSGLMNAVMLPMWIGSGVFFTNERFPQFIQPALALLPLTPVIEALRKVMLEGVSLFSLGGHVFLITAWGIVTLLLALRWFRWT